MQTTNNLPHNAIMSDDEFNALVAAKTAQRAQLVQQAIRQAQVSALMNDDLQALLAKQDFKDSQTNILRNWVQQLSSLYITVPSYKDGKVRDARPSRLFNQGEQLDLLTQVVSLVLYAPKEHRTLIPGIVPTVSQSVMEQFLGSQGRSAFVPRESLEVTEEVPFNFNKLVESVQLLSSMLDVVIDTSELSSQRMAADFTRARNEAEKEALQKVRNAEDEAKGKLFTM